MRFETASACRACNLHAFCEKSPSMSRSEFMEPEKEDPYYCDVTHHRAQNFPR
jgi:hypothetical protein